MDLSFVSYAQFLKDIDALERKVPPIDAVVGIPRSGLIPASYIALKRNVPVIPLPEFLRAPDEWRSSYSLRKNNPARKKKACGTYLIVDDSLANGVTFSSVQSHSNFNRHSMLCAVVYDAGIKQDFVDYTVRTIPHPRLFEWNFMRNRLISQAAWDIDGVVCEDWLGDEQSQPDLYQQHLANVEPLYLPARPVGAFITNRLDKYTETTKQWLRDHHVPFSDNVYFCEAATPQERKQRDNPRGVLKAAQLDRLGLNFFVESDSRQAKVIAAKTGKPVIATDTMTLFKR